MTSALLPATDETAHGAAEGLITPRPACCALCLSQESVWPPHQLTCPPAPPPCPPVPSVQVHLCAWGARAAAQPLQQQPYSSSRPTAALRQRWRLRVCCATAATAAACCCTGALSPRSSNVPQLGGRALQVRFKMPLCARPNRAVRAAASHRQQRRPWRQQQRAQQWPGSCDSSSSPAA